MNDDYEPVLDDPDLGGPDWLMLAIGGLGGFALVGAAAAWWLSRD